MNILLVANLKKPKALELTNEIHTYLQKHSVSVFGAPDQAKKFGLTRFTDDAHIDLIISLGGDGSILKIVHEYPKLLAPIMGINLGSLGFLADIPIPHTFEALDQILRGAYSVQERLMLEGHTKNQVCFAINDMVVHRGPNHGLVDLSVKVDGKHCNTFSADGLIVATPSGSTAYSLSSGGPILTPELEACVITPICPHTISNRPIVLQMNKEIEIQYLSALEPVEVAFDGMSAFSLQPNETFTICPASRRFRLVTLENVDYFQTLRKKLGWTGTLKIE